MKFFAGVFLSLFHLYSRRVFLNIPLFDEFIRIPKMKSDKPRACTGQKATHLQHFIEKQSHFDHHYKPFFYLFFFAFSPFFFLSSYFTFDFVVFYLLYLLWSSFFICWLPFLLLFDSGFSFVWLCYFTSIWITGHKRININYTTKLNHRRRRCRAPAMIHQNWKLTAGQGIH